MGSWKEIFDTVSLMRNETNFSGEPEEREECVYTGWANQHIPSWWSVFKKTRSPIPKSHLWSSPLSQTLNPTTSITYWTKPLTNPTTSFQLSSPSQDTCDSRRCSTQLSGAGAGSLTAHSPSDSTMKQSTFNRAEEPPGKFTANSTSPWPGTPLF